MSRFSAGGLLGIMWLNFLHSRLSRSENQLPSILVIPLIELEIFGLARRDLVIASALVVVS